MDKLFYNIYTRIAVRKPLGLGVLFAIIIALFFLASHIEFEEDITKLIPQTEKSSEAQKVLKQVNFADKIIVNSKDAKKYLYKILKLKVTYSVWELYPEIANNLSLFKSKLLTRIFKKLDTYSMKNTDNLVVNSPELRNYLIANRDLSKKNIEVITHFSPYPLSENYPNLDLKKMFYAGNLGKPQNLEKFIQMSIEHDVKWELDIYGAGTEYVNIEKYVNAEINLNKHIERNELIKKISDIPVALISLDERITIEGFPGKTFDYLSMNKVLLSISNKDSAVAKFIEKYSLGVNIEPDSVKSFLDAFEKLSSQQFLSETLLNVSNINKNQIKKSEIVKQYLTLI